MIIVLEKGDEIVMLILRDGNGKFAPTRNTALVIGAGDEIESGKTVTEAVATKIKGAADLVVALKKDDNLAEVITKIRADTTGWIASHTNNNNNNNNNVIKSPDVLDAFFRGTTENMLMPFAGRMVVQSKMSEFERHMAVAVESSPEEARKKEMEKKEKLARKQQNKQGRK